MEKDLDTCGCMMRQHRNVGMMSRWCSTVEIGNTKGSSRVVMRSGSGSTNKTKNTRGNSRRLGLLCLSIGAVSFIGLLLLAHGVESNPGPVTGRRHVCISELSSALRALHDEMKDVTRRWIVLITRYSSLCFV